MCKFTLLLSLKVFFVKNLQKINSPLFFQNHIFRTIISQVIVVNSTEILSTFLLRIRAVLPGLTFTGIHLKEKELSKKTHPMELYYYIK